MKISSFWTKVGNKVFLGLKIVYTTTKKIKIIQQMLKTVQSQQKSYADQRRRALEYDTGDHVFIRILKRLDPIAYQIALLLGIEQMHNVFHVSMLRGYLQDPFHVIDYHQIALDDNMKYEEKPIHIINWQVKQLKNREIPMVKVE
ncbi:uncharacterized protein LOC114298530 [Camellia sinensis]|uniref:uncharacterized protein LOC114298530 n=1 Tax=Camellia sinensis TaxID=4442 RepID=UPI0010367286|nr:uncharacterized protein LOC114298530 [Camellia sinensis]